MKKNDVRVGALYEAKVSNNWTIVKIISESPYGGWVGRNESTGREVRIRSAQRLTLVGVRHV